jgi:fatty-acyl-CoA synthase
VLSGDRARIDEEGGIVMLGRGSQCINTGGEKVFTEEVEEAARRCPAVQDVLVIGIPDERWGQKVAAVVEVMPGAEFSVARFQSVCRQHLSGYKVPRAVYLVDKMMRSPAGKADYRWAREYVAQHSSVI